MSRHERNSNYHKGKRDGRQGKSTPPDTGFNWKTGAVVGGLLGGPVGAVIGGLLGDSDRESRRKTGNNKSYKAGNRKGKNR